MRNRPHGMPPPARHARLETDASEALVRALTLALLTLSLTTACEEVEDPCEAFEGAPGTVCVQTQDGDPLAPTEVYWSFPQESTQWDGTHEPDCVDALCSVFALPPEAEGEVVVLANWAGPPHYTPGCVYYDSAEVTVLGDLLSPDLVILMLDTGASQC